MKKLLAGLLLLCLLPALAFAAPDTPYDHGLMLRYFTLSQIQKEIFDLCYQAACEGESRVELPPNTAYSDAKTAMAALLSDCPELCALERNYRVHYYRDMPEIATEITLEYRLPMSSQQQLIRRAKELAAQAKGSAWDKELYLHDLVCAMTEYDLTTNAQATAYGALMEGRAGCEGYTRAMVLLCRLAGIPCGMVAGDAQGGVGSGRHAWCVLSVGGAFTFADPTWNDSGSLGNTHWYFNLTGEQMNRDHTPDEELLLPPCTDESVNWHKRNGLLVSADSAEARQTIYEALYNLSVYGRPLNLRFENPADAAAFADNCERWMDDYNSAYPDYAFYGSYSVSREDTQGCVIIARPASFAE